jgi:hypothetical protein
MTMAVEMRRMDAGTGECHELRVALAAYVGGAHATEERAARQLSERMELAGARIDERRHIGQRAAGDEVQVQPHPESRRAGAHERHCFVECRRVHHHRRRRERPRLVCFHDPAVDAWREAEVVRVDDQETG